MAVGEELGDRAVDAAEHDPGEGHEQGVAELDATDQGDEEQGAGEGEAEGEQHLPHHGRTGEEEGGDEEAAGGGVDGAGGGGGHEPVLGELLHDEAGDGEGRAGQHEGGGAGHTGEEERPTRLRVGQHGVEADVEHADEQRDDDQGGHGAGRHPHPATSEGGGRCSGHQSTIESSSSIIVCTELRPP